MLRVSLMMTLGHWICVRRRAAGLSQAVLAAKLGVVQGTISGWERGYYEVSRVDLVRVFEVLQVDESEWAAVLRLPRELAEPAGAAA